MLVGGSMEHSGFLNLAAYVLHISNWCTFFNLQFLHISRFAFMQDIDVVTFKISVSWMDIRWMPSIVQMTFTKKSISAVINNSANEMISAVYLENRRKQRVYCQDNPNQCSLGNPQGVEFIGKSSWGLKFCVEKLKKKTPRSPHWEVPLCQMLCLRSPAHILGNN